jgi:tRNA (pseudouridine54-N1)-methyltransferase
MNLIFFIKSATVNLTRYTIKDIPGSSGRLDVISRCVLAALLNKNGFEENLEIWTFLDNFGTYIFDPQLLDYETFPKTELLLTDSFVNFLQGRVKDNPLRSITISDLTMIKAIEKFQGLNYEIFILKEDGLPFLDLISEVSEKNSIFIMGSQEDAFLNTKELLELNLQTMSFGAQSYLASSVIRLLKLHIRAL